jgi:hypothetical protein
VAPAGARINRDLDAWRQLTRGCRTRELAFVQLATSTDSYFGSDSVALRATFRFGAKITHTDRVIELTVAEPCS